MAQLTQPVNEQDHTIGPANAPVTLVEYGDFECPHCLEAYPIVKSIKAQLGDQLHYVFRHFPLTMDHPNAQKAAESAEAAAQQGKFWQMHDLLFENQARFSLETFVELARQLGINPEWFQTALAEDRFAEQVLADFNSGVRSGVNGTPTFFINGERYDGIWNQGDSLLQALQEAAEQNVR